MNEGKVGAPFEYSHSYMHFLAFLKIGFKMCELWCESWLMPLKMIWMNMFIYAPSVLSGIKEKLEVTDLINQLDIADGLKELLLSSSFTLKSLLSASVSDLAKTLGIDDHVAKLVSDAVNKAIKRSRSIPWYRPLKEKERRWTPIPEAEQFQYNYCWFFFYCIILIHYS